MHRCIYRCLVKDRSNSSALTVELLQSFTEPSICITRPQWIQQTVFAQNNGKFRIPDLYHHMASLGHNELTWSITALQTQVEEFRDYRSQMSLVDLHLSVRGVGHYHLWDNLSYTTYRSRCLLQLLMAWCHQATSCYLSQCWLSSVPPYRINRPQWVNMANHCLQSHSWKIYQSHKSHTAPVPYPTMHNSEQKCVHFCSEWCIVGYGTDACWGMGQMHCGIYEIGLMWL